MQFIQIGCEDLILCVKIAQKYEMDNITKIDT